MTEETRIYDSKPGPTTPVYADAAWEPTVELRTNTVTYREGDKHWVAFLWPAPTVVTTFMEQLWRRDMNDGFEYEWRPIPNVTTERNFEEPPVQ